MVPCSKSCTEGSYACSDYHKQLLDTILGSDREDLKKHISTAIFTQEGADAAYSTALKVVKMESAKVQYNMEESSKKALEVINTSIKTSMAAEKYVWAL